MLILGVNGSERGAAGGKDQVLLNGELTPTVSLKRGIPDRVRLINMTADRTGLTFFVMKPTDLANWKMIAKGGADLPARRQVIGPARQQVSVGETYDFELVIRAPIVLR